MAKKYQQQTYTGSYSGAAQSLGFNPVKAVDESKGFKQRTAERNRDLKTYSSYLQRKGVVDQSQLSADRAKANAQWGALKGVLSLTKQGISMVEQMEAQSKRDEAEKAAEFETQQALDAMADMGSASPTGTEAAQTIVDTNNDLRVGITAEAQAINETANESDLTPGVDNSFRQSATQVKFTGVLGNVYSARDGHMPYLQARMDELPPEQRPSTEAEALALTRKWSGEYLKATGVLNDGMTKALAAEKLPGTFMQNNVNLARATVKQFIEMNQKANAAVLDNTLYQGAMGGESAENLWRTASDDAAFGNIGFSGRSAGSNAEAIERLLSAYVSAENVIGLQELKRVQKIPGNPGAGTLGDAYGLEIDNAIDKARDGRVQDWNRGMRDRKMVAEQMIRDYYENPGSVDKAQLAEQLRTLGPTGRAEANRILSAGLRNDPDLELDIARRAAEGKPYSQYELEGFLSSGLIRESVYKEQIKSSKGAQIDKQVAEATRTALPAIKSGMLTTAGKAVLTDVQKIQVNTRAGVFQKDLEQRLQSEAKAAGVIDNVVELEKMKAQIIETMLKEPRYQMKEGEKLGSADWGAPLSQITEHHAAITPLPGQQDIRGLTAATIESQVVIRRSELSHIDDYILKQSEAAEAAVITDGNYSDRINRISEYMRISPKALVEGQLQRYNMPSLHTFKLQQNQPENVNTSENLGKASGYAYIRNDLGFPERGAAYLTSAIDHESTWHGTRQWGEVAGDGTNRNGGLISWASWSNNSARLGAIERHFGRNIAEIPERQQLEYMKLEMQRSYKDAYRVFMNPNASSADLQWAVSRYWGFDPRYTGSRWTDAEKYIQNPPLQYSR